MFCSLMSVFMYFSGFESFAPLERWCDFAKFWCGKKKLVAVICFLRNTVIYNLEKKKDPLGPIASKGSPGLHCPLWKTKIKFSGHPPDRIFWILPCIVKIYALLSASSTVALYPIHQYVFFETHNRSMWWTDGVAVAQRILKGLNMNCYIPYEC